MMYRNKPVCIDAVQFTGTGESCSDVLDLLGGPDSEGARWKSRTNDGGWIVTPEGAMEFSAGDWIIREANGVFSACTADRFAATYEPVSLPLEGADDGK